MHPKRLQRKQLDVAEAMVKGLAAMELALARFEKKIDILIAWMEEAESEG